MAPGEFVRRFQRDRRRLVERLEARGITDLAVLHAFDRIPRHLFVPAELHLRAYEDEALPIGFEQTISRPSVHALHLMLAELEGHERVLEVGTGSGFQTALLAVLAADVFSIERVRPLATLAARRLELLGLHATIRIGDGSAGWPREAPFDVILLGAAAPSVPVALQDQLAEGGRLIAPVGDRQGQSLVRLRREKAAVQCERIRIARFVPLVAGRSP